MEQDQSDKWRLSQDAAGCPGCFSQPPESKSVARWTVKGTMNDGCSSLCSGCLHGDDGCWAVGLPLSLPFIFYCSQ